MSTIGLLLALALVLFFVEIFAPGGFLGFLGCILIFAAAIVAYQDHGALWGLLVLFGGLALAGAFFFFEVRVLMHSSFSRRLFAHEKRQEARVGLADDVVSRLIGQTGESVTRMTPTGKIRLGDRVYAAISLDGYLAKGTPLVVKEANPVSIKVSRLS